MATIKTTDESFDQVVLKSDKPFVQRFTAEWCGPCKMIAPLLEELSDELKDKVLFGSHNIDDEPNTPTKFGIKANTSKGITEALHEIANEDPNAIIIITGSLYLMGEVLNLN